MTATPAIRGRAARFASALILVLSSASTAVLADPAGAATLHDAATSAAAFPATPPAQICGNAAILNGPDAAPFGFVTVPAGDNSGILWALQPSLLFWFAPGIHTLGGLSISQIVAPAYSVFLGAPGAIIDGQGVNQFAFTQTAAGVIVRHLTIQNFVGAMDNGVVNHDSGANWTIEFNTIANNGGAGVTVGPNNIVAYNCLKSNGQYGFNVYHNGGDANITIDHNEVANNNTGNWDVVIPGCGCVGAGKVWNTTNGSITNNWVHNNVGPGIWVDTNNAGILIDGNYIADNDEEAVIYEVSYNAQITNNNLLRNGYVKGRSFAAQGSTFPAPAIYISNSGGDSRVDNGIYATFTIAGNSLVDNWGGVTLWEDANRFCGSDLSLYCTLGNPSVNLLTCAPVLINLQPALSDCRWKTQNVSVHDNQFSFSRAHVGCSTTGCGEQAILANAGTAPLWSPYMGNGINVALTTQQNNHFANNTYVGDWQFAWQTTTPMTLTQWQGPPSNQDAGSTLNGVGISPPAPGNLIDADTASIEGSIGHWAPWFSTSIAQTTTKAQAGSHSLQVNIIGDYGWGVQLNNWPGFAAAAGPQTISYWGLLGAGAVGTDLQVQWRGADGAVLATNDVVNNALTTTWQQSSTNVTAPSGTTSFTVTVNGAAGHAGVSGSVVFLDQIFVGTVAPGGGNVLDANTASLEASLGHWVPWYSTTIAKNAAKGEAGTHSLKVTITAPGGWGVQLNNAPGFPITPGPRTIRFWGLSTVKKLGATMTAQWRDAGDNVLATTSASITALAKTWQQATATATAPPGTAFVTITVSGTTGVAKNALFLDDFYVGS